MHDSSPSVRSARLGWTTHAVVAIAVLGLLGVASSASALLLTGGPTYALPGGGSCTVSGTTSLTNGALVTCTGVSLPSHTKVYFGIRNDTNVNGNTMTGAAPGAASAAVFRFSASTANSITYTSTSSVASSQPSLGTQTVTNRLVLTLTTGTGSVVATSNTPAFIANNTFGDITNVFQITSGTSFQVRAEVRASDPLFALGAACPNVYDPSHCTFGNLGDVSKVDVAFYYSDCGDGQVDSPEQCDDGGANGSAGSCCSSTCTFKANLTACTDDGIQCTNDQCNGASNLCMHPNKTNGTACTGNGTSECSGADTCQAGACLNNDVAANTPCTDTSPPSSGNCKDAQCNGTGSCDQNFANETNGTGCNDSLFCNGADTCNAGTCSNHAGDPCPGADGDGNCSESCNEAADDCTAPDPNGSACTDGLFCTGTDTCSAGACTVHTGDPCPGADGDGNCSESCNEAADNCLAADPNGSACTGNGTSECSGADTCQAGACSNNDVSAGTACTDTSPPSAGNCKDAQCNGSGTCDQNFANETNGTSCDDSLFCNGTDSCTAGACSTHSGDPCPGPDGDGDCSESCDEAADNCLAADPNGSSCTDGLFCNGTDSCSAGACSTHSGDPCPGPDGDGNCAESCDEAADNCLGDDPNGSACSDGLFCDGTETCSGGTCGSSTGDPCPGPDGDSDCSESCNETADNCTTNDPNGSACSDGLFCDGTETCSSGTCGSSTGDPCPGPDGDGDCSESCNEAGNDCSAPDPNGSSCTDGLFCNGTDMCASGACTTHSGDPCPGPDGDGNCAESCDEAADNCLGDDPNGSACSDGLFCDGTETCSSGTCGSSTGDPCPGPDGDTNCSESCNEAGNNCLGADPDGTLCRPDSGECDVQETCLSGACPADDFEPNGTACGSPSDTDCDNPDTCDGNNNCLTNLETAGTSCPDDGETCTTDECNGSGTCTHPAGNGGTVCRPQAMGQLCDEAELCDGSTPSCPSDGVKAMGTVCRPDAGECDTAEVCDGSSSACPPNIAAIAGTPCGSPSDTICSNPDTCDGVGNCDPNNELNTVQCRAASAGLSCDAAENCDGAGNCPPDIGQPNGTPCRPAAGMCDLAETCDGTVSNCPADAKSTAPCRASAGVCDLAESCDGVGNNCPADTKSTGVCRPALDPICDVGESCDGIGDNCPADVITPNGTSCTDGLYCNGAETCQAGDCSAGADPCALGCDEGTDTCQTCAGAPLSLCRTALKSLLLLKNGSPDDKDRLVWKWIKGQATSQMEFADPTDTASYSLCIYDNNGANLAGQMGIAPNPTKWQAVSDKGYKYTDLSHTSDGAFKVKLKGSTTSKSKALVKGRGMELPDPLAMQLVLPVKVQLVNNQTGICFQSDFMTAKTNTTSKFKAKAP